jgi:predicted NUDIX family NTP pyrophosphohydrolase
MAKRSAGVLLWRRCRTCGDGSRASGCEVLLVHPGGPFWAKKDAGAWSIPKGLVEAGEDELAAARREFFEETGFAPEGEAMPLGEIKQAGGKVVIAWAIEGDFDPSQLRSNTFQMEWPPKSGKMAEFPEVDRAGWFEGQTAQGKLLQSQKLLLNNLANIANLKKLR